MILYHIGQTYQEMVKAVPISQGAYQYQVVFSIGLEVDPTDFLLVLAQCEVTNPFQFNVGLGRYICRVGSSSGANGPRIIPANMDNITPSMHHKQVVLWGSDMGASGLVYYNMVLYCAAMGGSGNLIVEPGYGKMIVMQFKEEC